MAATHAARPRLLTPIIAGIVLAVVFGFVAFVAAAGGDGTYIPAALFFPCALLLAIGLDVISNAVLCIAVVQWPLYGAVVVFAARRGRRKEAIVCLAVIHSMLIAACFLLDRRGQFV
jgi:hypothetical protein